MTVFDNLENYEIPAGYTLSLEQDEELSKVIAEIVTELDKRKASKLETRKYFRQHLCYSTNILRDNALRGRDGDQYDEGESYTPLEGEYTWPSDLLQPALLSVLRVEMLKYGYIINLLLDDLKSRGIDQVAKVYKVSDGVIQFAQEFDIYSIKEEIAKIDDIRRRIVFLRTKMAEMESSDLLASYEKDPWLIEYKGKINSLIKLEEKKLELYPSGFEKAVSVPSPVPEVTYNRTLYNAVSDYCKNDDSTSEIAYSLLLKAVNLENSTVDRSLVEEMFTFVDNSFAHFLDSCDFLSQHKINDIFTYTDQWFEHFKEKIDDANTRCQQSIKVSVQKKLTSLKREVLNKISLTYANFIIEKAITVVSGLKANILFNHRYEIEVYYNIYDDPREAYYAERDRLEHKFGAGEERDIYFDMYTNIEAFYEKATKLVRDGLIEASINPNAFEDDDETSQYEEKLRTMIEQGVSFYVEEMKYRYSLNSETFHEASSWIETTRYCLGNVIIAAELWAACDENRREMVNYSVFQQFNIEFLPILLDENLLKYKTDTANDDINEQLNNLGERDADEWDDAVPVFDHEVLTDTFITKEAIDDAVRNDPSRIFSVDNILTGEEAEAYLKQLDSESKKENHSATKESLQYILLAGRESELIQYINEHIDRKVRTNAICLLLAARELGYTGKLTHSVAESLFGKFAARSTFNSYYNGERPVDPSVVATYKTALEKHFKTTPSSTE